MNESDKDKIDFIVANLKVSNVVSILTLMDRAEIVKAIELTPIDEKDSYHYKILRHTLTYLDNIQKEQFDAYPNG